MGMGIYIQNMVGMKRRSKSRQGEGCIGTKSIREARGATVTHITPIQPFKYCQMLSETNVAAAKVLLFKEIDIA